MTNEEAITYADCLKNNYTINFEYMTDFCNTVIKALEQLSKIEDIIEELNHIATEPYDVDDYQEGVTDGIQLAIKTINTKIKERTNSGGNVADKEIEEAIDLLDNLIGAVEDNHNSDYDKAIKMGIEALKRLSNTSNDERRQQYEKPRKIKRIL